MLPSIHKLRRMTKEAQEESVRLGREKASIAVDRRWPSLEKDILKAVEKGFTFLTLTTFCLSYWEQVVLTERLIDHGFSVKRGYRDPGGEYLAISWT